MANDPVVNKTKFKLSLPSKKTVLMMVVLLAIIGAGGFLIQKKRFPDSHAPHDTHVTNHEVKHSPTTEPKSVLNEDGTIPYHVEWSFGGLMKLLYTAYLNFDIKVDRFYRADRENKKLHLENVNLKLQAEQLQFNHLEKVAEKKTHETKLTLSKETGGRVGRTLAGIAYRPPVHLLPTQLHTLGVSYFKGREFEKAAVIFTFLVEMDDVDLFKTARDYVLTGAAWYRNENYIIAEQYFEKALRTQKSPADLKFHAQARLWNALTAERMNRPAHAQKWMRELVDHHPDAQESQWINAAAFSRKAKAHADASGLTQESKPLPELEKTPHTDRIPAHEEPAVGAAPQATESSPHHEKESH